jgi:hypothetical protein
MHDHGTPAQEDLRTQSAVLGVLLSEHPVLLTLGDLLLEEIDSEDNVSRAVRDLNAVGLLRREGGSVLPTRAALRFDGLPE